MTMDPPNEMNIASEDDVAVRVDDVSKIYGLWSSPGARLQHVVLEMAKGLLPTNSNLVHRIDCKIDAIYRQFKALESVSLQIKKGESWGFIGVNGSGKSTLLKMISGNLRPSSGRIEVDGRVAILDYSSGLHGDFTGVENIFLKSSVLGMSRRETESKLQSIIDFADIGEFIRQPVKTYSSGMMARLGFAIVAHADADIIITDEALAVGDAFFVQKCMDHIRAFLKRGTFLFVSHSTNDVISLCQNAVWLEHGHIRQIGTAKEVAQAYLSSQSISNSERFIKSRQLEDAAEEGTKTAADSHGSKDLKDIQLTLGKTDRELIQPELSQLMHSKATRKIRDSRLEFINRSQWRNDIEIPNIDMSAGSGVGGAKIEQVTLEGEDDTVLTWAIGGESVRLRILATAQRRLTSPILGFQLIDRLGQVLFADNTYLVTLQKPLHVAAGQWFDAEFDFQMPLLPVGDYAVRVSVAEGADGNGAMMHRIQTALVFKSVTSGARHGLVGVPMDRVKIGIYEPFSESKSAATS